MRYDGKSSEYFEPLEQIKITPAGATNLYIVGLNQVLRISVITATVFAKFSNDASMVIADNTNIELQIGTHFVSSGEYKFMSISVAGNANVIKVK